ncbi:MAG: DinB family protein [Gemmataceae bacterium]|nr:DinB family protein [Gemmataceae bacterium]
MSRLQHALDAIVFARHYTVELPPDYLQTFGRDPVVSPDPARYPSPADIRATFDRVHERALADLTDFPDADLDSGIGAAHRFCRTKLDCVRWCSAHEMLHTGQIGLLRRLFGHPPVW